MRPAAAGSKTSSAHTKCKHIYRKRNGWEVRNKMMPAGGYGGWFRDHAAAQLRACQLYNHTVKELEDIYIYI